MNRSAASVCAVTSAATSPLRVGSGRAFTKIVTVAGCDVPNALLSAYVNVTVPRTPSFAMKWIVTPSVLAVPAPAGGCETIVSAVNGPPRAPAVASIATPEPASVLAVSGDATGDGTGVGVGLGD